MRPARTPRTLVLTLACVIAIGFSVPLADGPEADTPPVSPGAATGLPEAAEEFRFAVIGDFGTGDAAEQAVAEQVRRWARTERAQALVTTGDNIYPDGERSSFEQAWYRPYGWVQSQDLPIIASLGNHDDNGSEGDRPVRDLLNMPARWYAASLPGVDLFVLDASAKAPPEQRQTRWLRSALAASTASWQIVVFHEPAFNCGRHGSTQTVIDAWVPIFERGGADLVLNGHDHNYQRFAPRNGVNYVVAGGSGAGLYSIRACGRDAPRLLAGNDDVNSFVAVEGSAEKLELQAIAADGRILDAVTLEPGPPGAPRGQRPAQD